VIVEAAVAAHIQGQVGRHKQAALRTGSERNPVEVAVPIVVHTVAVEAARMGVVHTVVEVVHTEMEVARRGVEAAHREVAAMDLAVG
jgi:hypothetical protein